MSNEEKVLDKIIPIQIQQYRRHIAFNAFMDRFIAVLAEFESNTWPSTAKSLISIGMGHHPLYDRVMAQLKKEDIKPVPD